MDICQNANLIITERKNGLWLGNIESGQDESFIRQNNIKTIFNITRKGYYESSGVTYIQVPLSDADTPAEIKKFLATINPLIESMHNELKKNSVLVHCEMGMQRSAAVVAAYLMKYYGMSPDDAVQFIRDRRIVAFKTRVTFLEALYKLYQQFRS